MTEQLTTYIHKADTQSLEFLLILYAEFKKNYDDISIEVQFDKLNSLCEKRNIKNTYKHLLAVNKIFDGINYDDSAKIIKMLPFDFNEFSGIIEPKMSYIEDKINNPSYSSKKNYNLELKGELTKILHYMYNNAPEGFQMTMVHLFGIRYAKELINQPLKEIAKEATGRDSLHVEIGKGIKLSRFVIITDAELLDFFKNN